MGFRHGWITPLVVAACGSPTPPLDAPPDNFDRPALLANLATQVLLPIQAEAASAAAAVPAAIRAYCDGLDVAQVGTTQDTARATWTAAIDAWEHADALLVGPAAMDNRTIRERIYGWPLLDPCGLDRATASSWADPPGYDVSAALPNVRSLAAVEYLLFTSSIAHNCATTPAGWDALGADLPRARCRQALVIATDVAGQAVALHDAWRADAGDYVGELTRAGDGSSIPTAQEGINRITDGIFYVDKYVKDMKLGEAAGISMNACGTVGVPCDREVELRFADRATFAIRANLDALRRAFTGTTATTDGPGFDDFLREVGHDDLGQRMVASLDAAIASAAALPDSFQAALATDRPKVVAVHTAITAFTDDLKSQFLTVLALEIPDDVAADND